MVAAFVLIILGFLILLFPTLLSIIVALLLIATGIGFGYLAYDFRRTASLRKARLIQIIFNN